MQIRKMEWREVAFVLKEVQSGLNIGRNSCIQGLPAIAWLFTSAGVNGNNYFSQRLERETWLRYVSVIYPPIKYLLHSTPSS